MDAIAARNLRTVRDYLAALAAGATGEALAHFFTPDARQIEYPNRLNPGGGESDLATLLARAEKGKLMIRDQRYEILNAIADGDTVAVEADWSAVLAIPVATLAAGDRMQAKFAMFFTMAEGRIRAQRNYDCFEPW